MTALIILFWVVGVGLIVGVAVYRGLKNGPTKFHSTSLELLENTRAEMRAEATEAASMLEARLLEVRGEVEGLRRQLTSLQRKQTGRNRKADVLREQAESRKPEEKKRHEEALKAGLEKFRATTRSLAKGPITVEQVIAETAASAKLILPLERSEKGFRAGKVPKSVIATSPRTGDGGNEG